MIGFEVNLQSISIVVRKYVMKSMRDDQSLLKSDNYIISLQVLGPAYIFINFLRQNSQINYACS